MLNIVIPMAGRGSRFSQAGFALPKPLIEIHGHPMIEVVIHNLCPSVKHHFIFLCLKEHLEQYGLRQKLTRWAPKCEIILVDRVTEGAACTVLLAKELINNREPLMIANSDQWVNFPIDRYMAQLGTQKLDGLIMTMYASDPKWSFVRLGEKGQVTEVVEKKVISNEATVGIYNFREGADFVKAADEMIKKNLRVNNEFYVAPVYNQMIAAGKKIGFFNVGKCQEVMYGLGTPEDFKYFAELPVSKKAVSA